MHTKIFIELKKKKKKKIENFFMCTKRIYWAIYPFYVHSSTQNGYIEQYIRFVLKYQWILRPTIISVLFLPYV